MFQAQASGFAFPRGSQDLCLTALLTTSGGDFLLVSLAAGSYDNS